MKSKISMWSLHEAPKEYIGGTAFFQFCLLVIYLSVYGATAYIENTEICSGKAFIISYIIVCLVLDIGSFFLLSTNFGVECCISIAPFALLVLMNTMSRFRRLSIVSVLIVVMVIMLYVAVFFIKSHYAKKRHKKLSLKKFVKKRITRVIAIFVIIIEGMAAISFTILYFVPEYRSEYIIAMKKYTTILSSINAEVLEIEELSLVEMYQEDLLTLFSDNDYKVLSSEEKIYKLQNVTNYIMGNLGVNVPVQLKIENGLDDNLMGYTEGDNIHLNSTVFESSGSWTLFTIYHEAYHIYQSHVCEAFNKFDVSHKDSNLMIYKELAQWSYEFEHYKSGVECYETYAEQSIEKTADEYATREMHSIMQELNIIE